MVEIENVRLVPIDWTSDFYSEAYVPTDLSNVGAVYMLLFPRAITLADWADIKTQTSIYPDVSGDIVLYPIDVLSTIEYKSMHCSANFSIAANDPNRLVNNIVIVDNTTDQRLIANRYLQTFIDLSIVQRINVDIYVYRKEFMVEGDPTFVMQVAVTTHVGDESGATDAFLASKHPYLLESYASPTGLLIPRVYAPSGVETVMDLANDMIVNSKKQLSPVFDITNAAATINGAVGVGPAPMFAVNTTGAAIPGGTKGFKTMFQMYYYYDKAAITAAVQSVLPNFVQSDLGTPYIGFCTMYGSYLYSYTFFEGNIIIAIAGSNAYNKIDVFVVPDTMSVESFTQSEPYRLKINMFYDRIYFATGKRAFCISRNAAAVATRTPYTSSSPALTYYVDLFNGVTDTVASLDQIISDVEGDVYMPEFNDLGDIFLIANYNSDNLEGDKWHIGYANIFGQVSDPSTAKGNIDDFDYNLLNSFEISNRPDKTMLRGLYVSSALQLKAALEDNMIDLIALDSEFCITQVNDSQNYKIIYKLGDQLDRITVPINGFRWISNDYVCYGANVLSIYGESISNQGTFFGHAWTDIIDSKRGVTVKWDSNGIGAIRAFNTAYTMPTGNATFTLNVTPSSATVTVNGTAYTGARTLPIGSIVNWQATASGYRTESGTEVLTANISKSVTMVAAATITIPVSPSNATVTMNGTVGGTQTFSLGTNVSWSVSAIGYETKSGTISNVQNDVTLPTVVLGPIYSVYITMAAGQNDDNTTITINGQVFTGSTTTNYTGKLGDRIEWKVERGVVLPTNPLGFATQSGVMASLTGNVYMTITLNSIVTFTINPTPSDAVVRMSVDSGQTWVTGNSQNLESAIPIMWQVTRTGYLPQSSTINLPSTSNTTLNVTLDEAAVLTVSPTPSDVIVQINGVVTRTVTVRKGASVEVTVSGQKYYTKTQTVVVSQDMTLPVTLDKVQVTITFRLTGTNLYSVVIYGTTTYIGNNSTLTRDIDTTMILAVTYKVRKVYTYSQYPQIVFDVNKTIEIK